MALLAVLTACSSRPPAPVVERSSQPPKAEIPVDGLHRVHRGDTLHGIAFKYGLDYRDVAQWNGIRSPYTIFPDQVIRLRKPPATAQTRPASQPRATTRTVTEPTPSPRSSTRTAPEKPAATVANKPQPPAAAKKPATAPPTTVTSTASAKGWQWPVQGRLLRTFKAGDPARNGIDIASRIGTPVLAAAAGEVVYSGNGLIGYGELIIIKHDDSMLSAYANSSRRFAAEGERIQRGQKIAEVGRNDRNEQVLHFEIRRDGKPVDPLRYLPKR